MHSLLVVHADQVPPAPVVCMVTAGQARGGSSKLVIAAVLILQATVYALLPSFSVLRTRQYTTSIPNLVWPMPITHPTRRLPWSMHTRRPFRGLDTLSGFVVI